MAAFRNTAYVPTVTMSKNGRRVGRKPKDELRKLNHRVQITLTEDQYTAFTRWMAREGLTFESVAGCKMVLDRLKSDGFLTADGLLPDDD